MASKRERAWCYRGLAVWLGDGIGPRWLDSIRQCPHLCRLNILARTAGGRTKKRTASDRPAATTHERSLLHPGRRRNQAAYARSAGLRLSLSNKSRFSEKERRLGWWEYPSLPLFPPFYTPTPSPALMGRVTFFSPPSSSFYLCVHRAADLSIRFALQRPQLEKKNPQQKQNKGIMRQQIKDK